MYPILQIPNTVELISVTEAEQFLGQNTSDNNNKIEDALLEAQQVFEDLTPIVCQTSTFRTYITNYRNPIYLLKYPIQSIVAVKYGIENVEEDDDTEITLDTSKWRFDNRTTPATLTITEFPSLGQYDRLWVDFVAGWETADEVPVWIRRSFMLYAQSVLDQRTEYTTEDLKNVPNGFEACVNFYNLFQGDWNECR